MSNEKPPQSFAEAVVAIAVASGASQSPIVDEELSLRMREALREGSRKLKRQIEGFDSQAPAILASHAALEQQLIETIGSYLPHPEKVARLGYGNKVAVLEACLSEEWGLDVTNALLALNELRNSVAHHDPKQTKALLAALRKAVQKIGVTHDDLGVERLADTISSALTMLRIDPRHEPR